MAEAEKRGGDEDFYIVIEEIKRQVRFGFYGGCRDTVIGELLRYMILTNVGI